MSLEAKFKIRSLSKLTLASLLLASNCGKAPVQQQQQVAPQPTSAITSTLDGRKGIPNIEPIIELKKNNAPKIISTPPTSAFEDKQYTYNLKAIDDDGDSLTYSLIKTPYGAKIDSNLGVINWIPKYDKEADYLKLNYKVEFVVRVDDKNGGITDQTFTVEVNGVDLSDYILLAQHNLYVSKKHNLEKRNWFEAHEELNKIGARMLTLREFVDFLYVLKIGNARDGLGKELTKNEVVEIYEEITDMSKRLYDRAEWLDASFENDNASYENDSKKLRIHYNHRLIDGKLKPLNSEHLQDKIAGPLIINLDKWLNNATIHGLPLSGTEIAFNEKIEGVSFIYLESKKVAKFGVDLVADKYPHFTLNCAADPRALGKIRVAYDRRR